MSLELADLPAGDPRWDAALPVLQQLRPRLDLASLDTVLTDPAGARFTAAFDGGACLGVAGWRLMVTTVVGRKLYVDDLVTAAAHRSRGVGAALLAELRTRARELGATTLELDSGVQRFDAHRFYLRERMAISSHHFAQHLR